VLVNLFAPQVDEFIVAGIFKDQRLTAVAACFMICPLYLVATLYGHDFEHLIQRKLLQNRTSLALEGTFPHQQVGPLLVKRAAD
jgi:hypothetical protein